MTEKKLNIRGANPSLAKGHPLGYALRGQMTVRNQCHGGKHGIKLGTGINPPSNRSHLRGK